MEACLRIKDFKTFVYGSLLLHILAGTGLYQYYKNPQAKKKQAYNKRKQASLPQFKNFSELKLHPSSPSISYPKQAQKNRWQGKVSLIYFVDNQGLVDKIQLKKSSGHTSLDNFVLRKVARFRFLNQEPTWVSHRVHFQLKGEALDSLRLRHN